VAVSIRFSRWETPKKIYVTPEPGTLGSTASGIVTIKQLIPAIRDYEDELINLDLPPIMDQLLPWLPPVALARLFWASFSSEINLQQVVLSFLDVAIVAALIFGFIVLRIKQSDR